MVKVTKDQEEKTKYLINETHNAYEVGYFELQSIIRGLRRVVTSRETVDAIQVVTKDIRYYIKNPNLLTTNDLILQMLNRFHQN